jgi:hypothetical protein
MDRLGRSGRIEEVINPEQEIQKVRSLAAEIKELYYSNHSDPLISQRTYDIRGFLSSLLGMPDFMNFEDEVERVARESGIANLEHRYAALADHPEILNMFLQKD